MITDLLGVRLKIIRVIVGAGLKNEKFLDKEGIVRAVWMCNEDLRVVIQTDSGGMINVPIHDTCVISNVL